MNYGIPYMGSKSNIIKHLAMNFPRADHFYDLFGGGFSVTHYMLENKASRYKHFHYNEIKKDVTELVKSAIAGDFSYSRFKPQWISREEFFSKKDSDAYVRLIWSFGNNQQSYLFSQEIEPYKKSMHQAVVFDEFDSLALKVFGFHRWPPIANTITKKRIYLRQKIEHFRKTKAPDFLKCFLSEKQLEQLQQLQQLQQLRQLQELEQLERLERLERLQGLQQITPKASLKITSEDYRQVDILPGSVVYCDIPYKGAADYGNSFNHQDFYDWAASRDFPVFFSEYSCSDSRFKPIYTVGKMVTLSSKGQTKISKDHDREKLFANAKALVLTQANTSE